MAMVLGYVQIVRDSGSLSMKSPSPVQRVAGRQSTIVDIAIFAVHAKGVADKTAIVTNTGGTSHGK